jgi:hypothetical protein
VDAATAATRAVGCAHRTALHHLNRLEEEGRLGTRVRGSRAMTRKQSPHGAPNLWTTPWHTATPWYVHETKAMKKALDYEQTP